MSSSREGDRRVRKTRKALVQAFNDLVQVRSYGEIRVGDIAEDADVGRSTFYQHYAGKEDILVESMGFMLEYFASATSKDADVDGVERTLGHFWENRQLARDLLFGQASAHVLPRITREVAKRIEARLEARGGTPCLPRRLIAIQIAEAQFALIRAWLAGAAPATPRELAEALTRSSRASVEALLTSADAGARLVYDRRCR